MKKILSIILIILVIIFSILLYSRFIGVKGLKTNEIIIKDSIPVYYDGLKIVHFADLHYKKVIDENDVKKIINEINQIEPDIVFFTGDLVDDDYELTGKDIKFLIKEFSKIDAKYGSYAVLGDQDVSKKEMVYNIYLQSNFILLENTSTIIQNEKNEKILLTGFSSPSLKSSDIQNGFNSDDINISYKIVLIHEPDYVDTILKYRSDVNLVLSSHSINGSINLPIIKRFLLPKGAQKYYKPYYRINHSNLYISNGVGVDQVNFRFLNTPSINFYRLRNNV